MFKHYSARSVKILAMLEHGGSSSGHLHRSTHRLYSTQGFRRVYILADFQAAERLQPCPWARELSTTRDCRLHRRSRRALTRAPLVWSPSGLSRCGMARAALWVPQHLCMGVQRVRACAGGCRPAFPTPFKPCPHSLGACVGGRLRGRPGACAQSYPVSL